MTNPDPELLNVQKLEHRKSPTHTQDYADRVNILVSDTPGMSKMVTLVFGRDVAEIQVEQVIQTAEGKSVMTPTEVTAYRHELASITLPESAARGLAESLLASLSNKNKA